VLASFPWIIFSSARNPKNWINDGDGGGSKFYAEAEDNSQIISSAKDAELSCDEV
jgi:hypothetical protein